MSEGEQERAAGVGAEVDPSLLRSFFTPSAPLIIRPWTGTAAPGIHVGDGAPALPPTLSAAVAEKRTGFVRFAFDPERQIQWLTSEAAFPRPRPLHSYIPVESGMIPQRLREMLMSRSLAGRLGPDGGFPRWPIEPCVEELRALVWQTAREAGLAQEKEIFWPDGKACAAVLSHDLDSPEVYRRGDWQAFAELEESHGMRSSWHFCSSHLPHALPVLERLAARGHEIAWHGPRHDFRAAYLAPGRLQATIERHASLFSDFRVEGFRSPFYLRNPKAGPVLASVFSYDSSRRDTGAEFLSPHLREGCCTVFPFLRDGMLQLPITIPEDYSISGVVGQDAPAIAQVQLAKLEWIKEVGGLAVNLTHPARWLSLKPAAFGAYRTFIERLAADGSVAVMLAREAAACWRGRFAGMPASPPA